VGRSEQDIGGFTVVFMCGLQSFCNRERCIEMLAKECQKYQSLLYQNCGSSSAESLSSMSSGYSVGALSIGQMSQEISHSLMRSSQSYPHIPPTESSGRVHDPTPRSSLPIPSLDAVPPRGMGARDPVTAAVMQRGPFSFRPDVQLNQDPALSCNAGILVTESYGHHPHGVFRQYGRVEGDQNVSLSNLSSGSPVAVNATKVTKPKTITSGVSYRVNRLGEQSKPTYLSATHVNMVAPEERAGRLDVARHDRFHNRLSDSALTPSPSNHSSNVFIKPQQSWLSSPQTPTTYVSSLSSSSSFDCLYSSVTAGSETQYPLSSSCTPAGSTSSVLPAVNRLRLRNSNSESVDSPEYAKGMKCFISLLHDP